MDSPSSGGALVRGRFIRFLRPCVQRIERIRHDPSFKEDFEEHVVKLLQAREMGYARNSIEINVATAWEMHTPRASQVGLLRASGRKWRRRVVCGVTLIREQGRAS